MDFIDKFNANMEYIGSCNITDDSLGKRACVIIDTDTKFSPKLTLYCMYNGNVTTLKMNKRLYVSLQLEKYDTIYVDTIEEKSKTKMINGSWVSTSEKEKWLSKCRVIYKYQNY